MTFRDLLLSFGFWLVVVAMLLIYMHYKNQIQPVSIDFIELPQSVTINPDLK